MTLLALASRSHVKPADEVSIRRSSPLDVDAIRRHFLFPGIGRIATNNAASTQPPRELLDLCGALAPHYENVLVQPDGRIVVGGQATNLAGGYGVARINP